MNLYDIYETNIEKEKNGTPIKFGDATLYIASSNGSNNTKFAKRSLELSEKRANFELENPEERAKQVREVYAECVLVGWENVTDKDGKEIPYSKENALKLFNDLPRLFDKIVELASDINTFKDKKKELSAKN